MKNVEKEMTKTEEEALSKHFKDKEEEIAAELMREYEKNRVSLLERFLRECIGDNSINLVDSWKPDGKIIDGVSVQFDYVSYDTANRFYFLKHLDDTEAISDFNMNLYNQWIREYMPLEYVGRTNIVFIKGLYNEK